MSTARLVGSGVYWTVDFEEHALRGGWALVTVTDDELAHSIQAVDTEQFKTDVEAELYVADKASNGCHVSSVAIAMVRCSRVSDPSLQYGEFVSNDEPEIYETWFNKFQLALLSRYRDGEFADARSWRDLERQTYDPALVTLLEELSMFDDGSATEDVAAAVTIIESNMKEACAAVRSRLLD